MGMERACIKCYRNAFKRDNLATVIKYLKPVLLSNNNKEKTNCFPVLVFFFFIFIRPEMFFRNQFFRRNLTVTFSILN